ncbi:hypothetical protein BN80_133 [Yersinia phage phiR1-RT]|uniref:Uncharacterized protein n=2 Tax=Tegunavirus TaxID=1921704 RepID=A0A1V0DXR0_9CAUD|nr:hypothetical protein BN80_133 [Yersinia phage phiR1-RT]YP_010089734.1 hypothetical protein KNT60_gp154 [Yersinia phage fHe-Yen9-01]ARB05928.1 hypothetical protein fHeYen901_155 [Yersinia phage fHe-Yen9-01]CCI88707.1 hypothetical protein BN80_133 [Yersinia phage phiR1-RT]
MSSERIVIKIDLENQAFFTGEILNINRAVIRSNAIVGLVEDISGLVKITVQPNESTRPKTYYIHNNFDEVAEFMCKAK